jgi:hypothetical protein
MSFRRFMAGHQLRIRSDPILMMIVAVAGTTPYLLECAGKRQRPWRMSRTRASPGEPQSRYAAAVKDNK